MTVTTDQLDLIRVVLGVALVLTNVGVWYGVKLESEKNSESTKEKGWRLLVKSLAAEAALAFALLTVDTVISNRQKADIAVLFDRATKAELELAKLKQPRSLTAEKSDAVANAISRFSGTKYDVLAVPGVEASFISDINMALALKGKWQLVPVEYGAHFDFPPFGSIGTIGAAKGVLLVYISGSGFDDAVASLVAALNEVGIETTSRTIAGYRVTGTENMPPNIIHIHIGSKP